MAALDKTNGEILWTRVLGEGKSGHGGVRSCIMDDGDIVCAGYVGNSQPGVFIDTTKIVNQWVIVLRFCFCC